MKRKILIFLMVTILFGLCALTNLAQAQEQKAQLYLVADVIVKPSEVSQFVKAVKEEVAFYSKYKYTYSWNVYSSVDNHYYFVMPVNDFSDIDNFYKAGGEVADKAAEEYQAMGNLFKGTYEYMRFSVSTFRPDLSIIAENPKSAEGETNFLCWDFHYVKPGMENEYEELLQEFKALSKKKGIIQSWSAMVGGLGNDQPVYVMIARAKNAVDFYSDNAKMWGSLGEEGSALYQKFMKILRKRETKTGWYRPELSYTPEKE